MSGKRDRNKIAPRVVGISGSPRRNGNTDILLDKALEGASSEGAAVEKIFLNGLSFSPCQACGMCHASGVCGRRDDMAAIYKKIDGASALVIASPVYFGSVTAQLKAMIDRFHSAWVAKNVLRMGTRRAKRKGYFISAAGSAGKSYFTDARKIIRNLFATLDIIYSGELFCGGSDGKESVTDDEKAMKKAFMLGKDAAR